MNPVRRSHTDGNVFWGSRKRNVEPVSVRFKVHLVHHLREVDRLANWRARAPSEDDLLAGARGAKKSLAFGG